ncbi:MAG: DUF3105 domain-containing protein [Actinomycetes bacterium]
MKLLSSTRSSLVARASVLAVSALLLLGACGSPSPTEEPSSEGIDGVQTYGGLTRSHTEDPVDYPQSPPVGGDHNPVWLDCMGTVFDQPVPNENAVHSLEHGAVWITYDNSVSDADIATLAKLVDGQPYTMMSPYPDQASPITLTAWGVQLGVDSVDDARIAEFLTAYRQGPQTPEPGATCESGMMP